MAPQKERGAVASLSFCGATGNRTRDTRIFSPLLYQLSYGTMAFASNAGAKIRTFLTPASF